jgi:hypothetical protein
VVRAAAAAGLATLLELAVPAAQVAGAPGRERRGRTAGAGLAPPPTPGVDEAFTADNARTVDEAGALDGGVCDCRGALAQ